MISMPWEFNCPTCHQKGGMMLVPKHRNGVQGKYCKYCSDTNYVEFNQPYDAGASGRMDGE